MAGTTPQETGELVAEAMERKDVEAALELPERDAVPVDPQPGDQLRGHEQIWQALTDVVSVDARLLAGPAPTVLEADDVALVLARWTLETTDESGRPVQQSGPATDVLRRQSDGTWRSVLDNPAGARLAEEGVGPAGRTRP